MSFAIERYLKEDDPLKKTLATGDGENKSGNGASAKGVDKGSNLASGHAPKDAQDTIAGMEKHMRGHQEQCQCSKECDSSPTTVNEGRRQSPLVAKVGLGLR